MDIPLFSQGEWSNCEHPVPDSDWDDYDKWMRDGGYARAEGFFVHDGSPLGLVVWHWQKPRARDYGVPQYLVDVETGLAIETVAAATVVDLMNLLAMWAPALRAGDASEEAANRVRLRGGA